MWWAGDRQKGDKALELGADEIIDRSQVDWGKEIFSRTNRRGVDVVVDNVGKATLGISMKAVARGGRIVIIGNTSGPNAEIDIRFIFGKQISLIGSTMGNHQDFRDVTDLLWSGKLKPVIDRGYAPEPGQRGVFAHGAGRAFWQDRAATGT